MDNKITRTRLSNFLAYEWIFILVVIVIAVVGMEFIFSIASVRLSVGQTFSLYYDESVISTNKDGFKQMLLDNETFSYDVMKFNQEALLAENNVLYLRLSTQDADIIITDNHVEADGDKVAMKSRSYIDVYDMYDVDSLYSDANAYLRMFLKDELKNTKYSDASLSPEYADLDTTKIDQHFINRMKKDNRFRSSEKKEAGKLLERQRIEKLCIEVATFKKLLQADEELYASTGGEKSYFTYYTRGKQLLELSTNPEDIAEYKVFYENNKKSNLEKYGRETARYALKVDMLKSKKEGKRSPNEFFRLSGSADANDIVIQVFNFKDYQPELQFETVSFINSVVRNCSDVLD